MMPKENLLSNTHNQPSLKSGAVPAHALFGSMRLLSMLIAISLIAALVTYAMYRYTEKGIRENMEKSMQTVASSIALQIHPADIHHVRDRNAISSEEYKRLVQKLQNVQDSSDDIKKLYLLRNTEIGGTEFIADATSFIPQGEITGAANTLLHKGKVRPLPGDVYQEYIEPDALFKPFVKKGERKSEWGITMAAYSPVFNDEGVVIAVVGMDLVIDEFIQNIQETLVQFLLFMLVLVLLLVLLTILLVRFYGDRVEAMSEVDRQKDELLGIVSHQLATPVASMMWYLEMMEDGDLGELSPKIQEHIDVMQSVTETLKDLISMILDVSIIQLGRMHQEPRELNLSEFFLELVHAAKLRAKKSNINLQVEIPAQLPIAFLDKRLTRMTLANLLGNAIKYTEEDGDVFCTVKIIEDGDVLFCEIRDTGCGIPKADQDSVFQKLYRASNVRNKIGGNGFGLYVAKASVEAQGGSLLFESEEGVGTTFRVKIPIKKDLY